MVKPYNLEYTDSTLSMIYKSEVFQTLDEVQQQTFLKKYALHKKFHEMVSVVESLQEVIEEVEKFMPPLPPEAEAYFSVSKKSILEKVEMKDNVVFLSKSQFQKRVGPLIVCLQQGDEMDVTEEFCKGMLLSLFDLCHRQRRDLYILPFAEEVEVLAFHLHDLRQETFDLFINEFKTGVSKIEPALHKAVAIFEQCEVKKQAELMIVSNHHFVDYNEQTLANFTQQFQEMKLSVSAIAMSEEAFNRQPFEFVEKVFFVNE